MIIDVFAHILPEKFLEALRNKYGPVTIDHKANIPWIADLDVRLDLMDRNPDVLQVLSLACTPDLFKMWTPADAVDISRSANDALAELVMKHPSRFAGAVACLPLNDMDAAVQEAERAITQLGLKGVQLFSQLGAEPLDSPIYRPLYQRMSELNLPIWIHPLNPDLGDQANHEILRFGNAYSWPFTTTYAMLGLVASGIFDDFPDIKFITHHCGGLLPYQTGRLQGFGAGGGNAPVHFSNRAHNKRIDQLKLFYNDTATTGASAPLMCAYDFFGADRLLFGTDAPMPPNATWETIEAVEQMDIPAEEKEKIYVKNAVRLGIIN